MDKILNLDNGSFCCFIKNSIEFPQMNDTKSNPFLDLFYLTFFFTRFSHSIKENISIFFWQKLVLLYLQTLKKATKIGFL